MRRAVDAFWRLTLFPFREVIPVSEYAVGAAGVVIRAYYAIVLYLALGLHGEGRLLSNPNYVELLWPVKWLAHADWSSAVSGITLGLIIAALLALIFPRLFLARLFVFLLLFQYVALDNSYGKMNHGYYLTLLSGLGLVFVRGGGRLTDNTEMKNYLAGVFGVQALIMTTYTLAGWQKVVGAFLDFFEDGITFLHPDALALHVVAVTQAITPPTLFGGILLDYSILGMPLMLGAVYLEATALVAIFRPRLHTLYGVSLILMHLGIQATMGISFALGVLMVGVWIVGSPFKSHQFHLHATVRDLPWIGPVVSAIWCGLFRSSSRETIIFYDAECGICDRFVYTCIQSRLPQGVRFASQAGATYSSLKQEHPYLADIDSVVIYTRENGAEFIRVRSEAIVWMTSQLGGAHRCSFLLLIVPVPVLDIFYAMMARVRKRFFVNHNKCALLSPDQKRLFID